MFYGNNNVLFETNFEQHQRNANDVQSLLFLFNILINDSFLYIYKNVQVTDALNWDIYFKFIN